jgi:hypothetical protein
VKQHSSIRTSFAAALSLALFATPQLASAQTTMIAGLGGPVGFGTHCLSPNDDGSSDAIDIRPSFPLGLRFFTGQFNAVFVNTNGNITFNGALSTYTPQAFPVASQPMIAAYWADVDIRPFDDCGGIPNAFSPGNLGCGNPTENGVWWHLEPSRMIVTWDRVGYYHCHGDRRMSFQMVLTDARACGEIGDFDVEYRYNRCEWTTGDASLGSGGFGGTPAQAGFDAGDNVNFLAIPGSLSADVNTRLCTGSNVGTPGVWQFAIRNGMISTGAGTQTCGVGACVRTVPRCDNGNPLPCVPGPPQPEVCNGIDDDCNDHIDDGSQSCGVGACRRFVPLCVEGHSAACTPGTPHREQCGDGIDDDCDGLVDDGCGYDVQPTDAADDSYPVCRDPRCILLEGRAGPIGECSCRVPGAPIELPRAWWVIAALVIVTRPRRQRDRQRGRSST